ncbi:MAG: 5-methylcytosine-specific restriction endonuclease system specificity protein McrC [Acidiferrobacterales bacterium]|nr:5-methylcytosine-specific restriction endonuclease system specificity protein McrC [Acidiferrobacterales bacterium]
MDQATKPLIQNEEVNYVDQIPIRNIWLLMLYASDLYRDLDQSKKSVEDNPDDIPDLVAEILYRRVEQRIRRNLNFGYIARNDVLNRVRGRIDLFQTARQRLLDRGQVACHYNEFTVDTPRNRYVRDALRKMSTVVSSKSNLVNKCRSLALTLERMGVIGERPNHRTITVNQFGLHDANDRPMLQAAYLAFNLALPEEMIGTRVLSNPDRNSLWLRKLFEKSVAGFYDVKLSKKGWRVYPGERCYWPVDLESKTPQIDDILPGMQTDIVLSNKKLKKRIIIDTKFTSILKVGQFRKETLNSGYLYQIYAYLRTQEEQSELARNATGLLLHPVVDGTVYEAVKIQNHEIRFATVDLADSCVEIAKQLLNAVEVEF